MRCQLIQTKKIDDSNRAERKMLGFLQNLPEGYFVYRELQVSAPYRRRVRGMEKQQPDFVVAAPQIGVLCIEVKDWNLTRNCYTWRDQHTIEVSDKSTGHAWEIDNPASQADSYLYALRELVDGLDVFVSSIVAFPRVSRADFGNRLHNIELLRNPQSRFLLNLQRTLFREDLDRDAAHPEALLQRVVQNHARFRPSSESTVSQVHERLLPSSFRIGDYTARARNLRKLQTISEQQQRWIFGLDPRRNYLLDVPGSGKTNALISRAIHQVDMAGEAIPPTILITTYSANLETNIQRIFQHKIASSPHRQRYLDAIHIGCVPGLMEEMVTDTYGVDDLHTYRVDEESPAAFEARLREDVETILRSEPDRFRRFDEVFIDEIQDFDDFYLLVLDHLCRSKSYFFVGDIGQKIYDRSHNLERLGFATERIELPKTYQMFRTPRHMAKLATRFILKDALAAREFTEHGYGEDFRYPNQLRNIAEVLSAVHPEAEIASRVRALLDTTYSEEDIMVITSHDRLPRVEEELRSGSIACVRGEPREGRAVSVVGFMEVKGLEKEVVLVSGIEGLDHRRKPEGMFQDEAQKRRRELLARRQIYVALTRPLEQLIVYYQDASNPFVADLLEINSEILERQQVGQDA